MKQFIKTLIIVFGVLMLTGCELKYDESMIINEEGNVDIETLIVYDKELINSLISLSNMGNGDQLNEEDVPEATRSEIRKFLNSHMPTFTEDTNVELYEDEEEEYFGYKVVRNIGNIDSVSGTKNVEYSLYNTDEKENTQMFKKDKDVYYANFKLEMNGENDSDNNQQIDNSNINMFKQSIIFQVKLPQKAIDDNASEVSSDGKTLKWNIDLSKDENIEFSFRLKEASGVLASSGLSTDMLIMIVSIVVIAIIIVVILVLFAVRGKKQKLRSVEPLTQTIPSGAPKHDVVTSEVNEGFASTNNGQVTNMEVPTVNNSLNSVDNSNNTVSNSINVQSFENTNNNMVSSQTVNPVITPIEVQDINKQPVVAPTVVVPTPIEVQDNIMSFNQNNQNVINQVQELNSVQSVPVTNNVVMSGTVNLNENSLDQSAQSETSSSVIENVSEPINNIINSQEVNVFDTQNVDMPNLSQNVQDAVSTVENVNVQVPENTIITPNIDKPRTVELKETLVNNEGSNNIEDSQINNSLEDITNSNNSVLSADVNIFDQPVSASAVSNSNVTNNFDTSGNYSPLNESVNLEEVNNNVFNEKINVETPVEPVTSLETSVPVQEEISNVQTVPEIATSIEVPVMPKVETVISVPVSEGVNSVIEQNVVPQSENQEVIVNNENISDIIENVQTNDDVNNIPVDNSSNDNTTVSEEVKVEPEIQMLEADTSLDEPDIPLPEPVSEIVSEPMLEEATPLEEEHAGNKFIQTDFIEGNNQSNNNENV